MSLSELEQLKPGFMLIDSVGNFYRYINYMKVWKRNSQNATYKIICRPLNQGKHKSKNNFTSMDYDYSDNILIFNINELSIIKEETYV